MPLSHLDGQQVLRDIHDEVNSGIRTISIGSLIPDPYNYISLTYVVAGNGAGEIQTVTYKSGGSGGTTVAVLTLTYDSSNRISTITRS